MKNEKGKKRFSSVLHAVATLLAAGMAFTPATFAGPKTKKESRTDLGVIAHVGLDNGSASRLLLVRKSGRQYLYAAPSSASGVCVFDVTEPANPHKIERIAGEPETHAKELQLVGDTLAVSSEDVTSGSASVTTPRSVTILSMKDPANPQSIQTFEGVTSLVADEAHGIIYLSNAEGLWIIQAKKPEKPEPVDNYGA